MTGVIQPSSTYDVGNERQFRAQVVALIDQIKAILPQANAPIELTLVSDTSLRLSARGKDGTLRSVTLTLS